MVKKVRLQARAPPALAAAAVVILLVAGSLGGSASVPSPALRISGPHSPAVAVAPSGPTRSCQGPSSGARCAAVPSIPASVPLATADAWTNVTAGQLYSPPPLVGASLAYDPLDNYLVLFGGCSATLCPAPAQTWKFAGGNWSQVLTGPIQPPARSYASMAYDSKDGYVVLFGGWAGPTRPLNDTWAFVAGTWTNVTTPGPAPPPGGGASMTHDHIDSYLLMFGGGSSPSTPRAQTWRYVGGVWKNLTATAGAPPAARERAGMAWDDADGYALLFGGRNASGGLLNDSWTYVRGKWTPANLTSPATPPPRSGAMLTFSGADNAVFLFGGNGTNGPLNDMWRYSAGKWGNQTAGLTTAPAARTNAASLDTSIGWLPGGSLKQKNGFLLLVGGSAPGCTPCSLAGFNDTWVFEPGLSTVATGIPTVVEVGESTSLSAVVTGGSPPYRLSWQFGDGIGAVTPAPSHAYASSGSFTASVNAVDQAGVADAATVTITVVPGPVAVASVSRTTTDVGLTLWFNGSASGGASPYTFRWNLGDATTAIGSSTTHSYGATGTFTGNLTATDTVGGVGIQTFSIHVNPAMTFVASPPTGPVTAGKNTSFRVSVNSGTPPYAVNWSFGDGAFSSSASALHAYSVGGNYSVRLTLRDSAGMREEANFTVEVLNVTSSSPGPANFLGLTPGEWVALVLVLVAVVVVALLLRRRRPRRRPSEGPIAAAAVGESPWERGDESDSHGDSRSARRSAQRWGRR